MQLSLYSCRWCEHFDRLRTGTRCGFYERCRAKKPFSAVPVCFKPAKNRLGAPLSRKA